MFHEVKTLNNTYLYFTDMNIKVLLGVMDMYPTAPILIKTRHSDLVDLIRGTVLIHNRKNRVSTNPSEIAQWIPIRVKEIR